MRDNRDERLKTRSALFETWVRGMLPAGEITPEMVVSIARRCVEAEREGCERTARSVGATGLPNDAGRVRIHTAHDVAESIKIRDGWGPCPDCDGSNLSYKGSRRMHDSRCVRVLSGDQLRDRVRELEGGGEGTA